jgi:hypothetical protein
MIYMYIIAIVVGIGLGIWWTRRYGTGMPTPEEVQRAKQRRKDENTK